MATPAFSRALKFRALARLVVLVLFLASAASPFPAGGDVGSPATEPARIDLRGLIAPSRSIVGEIELSRQTAAESDRVDLNLARGLTVQGVLLVPSSGAPQELELEALEEPALVRIRLPATVQAGDIFTLRRGFNFKGSWVDLGGDVWALDPSHSLVEIARFLAGAGAQVRVVLEPPPGFEILGADRSPLLVPTKWMLVDREVAGSLVRWVAPRAAFQNTRWFPQPVVGDLPIRTTQITSGGPGAETTVGAGSSPGSYNTLSVTRAPDWGRSVQRRIQPPLLEVALHGIQAERRAFGPLGPDGLLLVQAERFSNGHSWPGLVLVPEADGRMPAGSLHEARLEELYFQVARQWWGHSVKPASDSDRWLVEGLAELGVMLGVERRGLSRAVRAHWDRRREALLSPTSAGVVPLDLGALAGSPTDADPRALATLRAFKGAFVLQALRVWMRENQAPEPDARFFTGLAEFAASYAGREATGKNLQRVMEKHFPASRMPSGRMDLDWFFDAWVTGISLPNLTSDLSVKPSSAGKFRIRGTVTLAGVPPNFRLRVPIHVDLGNLITYTATHLELDGPGVREVDLEVTAPGKLRNLRVSALGEILTR